MKAAIYCRVSTEDQEREGTSLQSQLEACKNLAQQKGYEVMEQHIIQEVYSGLTLERPNLTKLRGWLYAGEVHAVIVYDSDRFSRDGYDFVTLIRDCQRTKVELLCVTEPIEHGPIGELLSYVRGWASRREADKIKERTSRGRKIRIRSGKLCHGRASYLFWYNYIPGRGDGEGIRQIDPQTSEVIQDIYKWFVGEGLPIDHIIYRLREFGILSPSGKRMWARASVWALLKRQAYIGDAFTPPIIDR
jgi:site-specific DNA recombinase